MWFIALIPVFYKFCVYIARLLQGLSFGFQVRCIVFYWCVYSTRGVWDQHGLAARSPVAVGFMVVFVTFVVFVGLARIPETDTRNVYQMQVPGEYGLHGLWVCFIHPECCKLSYCFGF